MEQVILYANTTKQGNAPSFDTWKDAMLAYLQGKEEPHCRELAAFLSLGRWNFAVMMNRQDAEFLMQESKQRFGDEQPLQISGVGGMGGQGNNGGGDLRFNVEMVRGRDGRPGILIS